MRWASNDVAHRYGVSWNSYVGHGAPSGHHANQVVDFWNPGGRGYTLSEGKGDAIAAWLLGQHTIKPLEMLIWWSWWWKPGVGWKPYPGWAGPHGPGPDAHIHVVFK